MVQRIFQKPEFPPLDSAIEQELLGLLRAQTRVILVCKAMKELSGWEYGDCCNWVYYHAMQMGPQPPPCPYCGVRLLAMEAQQCFWCGMDWHDPANIVRRGKPEGHPAN